MAAKYKLSPPKVTTFYIALALAVLGLILEVLFLTGTKLAGFDMQIVAFVLVLAGFGLLALACNNKNL